MELKDHKFIILGCYSANVLGQIRSLGEKGINSIAILIRKNTFRIDKSKYISELYDFNDVTEALDFVIDKYGNELTKPFLYTDRDDVVGYIDNRYDEFKDKFYVWNACEQGRLNIYLNKFKQIELAKECGMNIPQTEIVKVGTLPKELSYPIFTKAVDSLNPFWKGNAFICNNSTDLINAYKKMDVKYILLQEYIQKQDEHPIEGISLNGGEIVRLFVKSINYRLTKDSFGIFRHLEPFDDSILEEKIKKFIGKIRYTGIFEIEFILDKSGKEYFLETNFRITQYNYAYTKFGVNLPYLYAKSILNGSKDAFNDVIYSQKRPFKVMSEFEDFKLSVVYGKTPFLEWIKDVRDTDCFSFYDSNDKKPFYYTLYSKICNIFK